MNEGRHAALRFDYAGLRRLLGSPAGTLVGGLALAVVFMLLPGSWTAALERHAAALLRPGQVAVLGLREHGRRLVGRARTHFDTARKLAQAEADRDRLAEENRRLAAELAVVESRASRRERESDDGRPRRLLSARCVKARVLGQLAQTFLGRHHLVDAGSESGVPLGAPVIDAPPGLIDQGAKVGVNAGQLVLDEGRVWGKVVRVGRLTSVVRTLTEPGYRDLVCLGESGPQGILEGTGEPLARVRLVEVTEPVSVGDAVYSLAGKGFLAEPLLCGRIVRLDRPVGAPHWEIWMQPAVDPQRTDEVAVLTIEVDPLRFAAGRRE